ncbi:hypothetical protein, conserved [Entamoeba dispar SAW760]|uniref:Uncharacterized protein n=1 Tax=Entamoeba dispar (strain ATCC PRA-260 / SAW760) TaxID=370354 RepID=B0EGW0_ENTDS|nr:uncharacterized protein EDI_100590 [Entamoeba dispar SAW760]EDR26225.1 hypothetical protein, conserved [Entamoeba dispar SAW760]|eukprot:EDR26225.1 hypothetical protein, conserved [Entamoeba dispar SAW760]
MSVRKFKHCMLGELGVGKTSIVLRYVEGIFDPSCKSTLGVNFLTKTCKVKGKKIDLNIWDTAGSERFRSMVSMYYRGVSSCMIVYDITNRQSFEGVESWYNQIKSEQDCENILIEIVGTKSDLSTQRVVKTIEGENLATKFGCLFAEVTSVEGDSVDKAFNNILDKVDISQFHCSTDEAIPVVEDTHNCC